MAKRLRVGAPHFGKGCEGLRLIKAIRTALVCALTAAPALGAEITKITSSFEPDDPFGMRIDLGFERTQQRGKITREWYQENDMQDVSELRFTSYDTRMNIDVRIGLWQDVEFHFGLPFVFQRDSYWGFAGQTNASNTTLYRNCQAANGTLLTTGDGCTTPGAGTGRLFNVDDSSRSFRGGLGDLTFGIAYAPFNQKKDDTKPTWVVGMDYSAPTAARLEPALPTSETDRGNIGDRIHRYKFYTSISKRIGTVDPYFSLHYTLPYRGPGWYSNCEQTETGTLGAPENCGVDAWPKTSTGIVPPHVGGVIFGSEFVPFEVPSKHQKFALDIRAMATYVSEGRYHNEMSDLMHKLLYTSDYLQLGGQIGFNAQAAEFISINVSAALSYNTEHFLTNEQVGRDLNGNGVVDPQPNEFGLRPELNPNFDWRADRVGRRFRISETSVFTLRATASFNF